MMTNSTEIAKITVTNDTDQSSSVFTATAEGGVRVVTLPPQGGTVTVKLEKVGAGTLEFTPRTVPVTRLEDGNSAVIDMAPGEKKRFGYQVTQDVPYMLIGGGPNGRLIAPDGEVIDPAPDPPIIKNPKKGVWVEEFQASEEYGEQASPGFATIPYLRVGAPVTTFRIGLQQMQIFTVQHDGVTPLTVTATPNNNALGYGIVLADVNTVQPVTMVQDAPLTLDNTVPAGDYLVQLIGTIPDVTLDGQVTLTR